MRALPPRCERPARRLLASLGLVAVAGSPGGCTAFKDDATPDAGALPSGANEAGPVCDPSLPFGTPVLVAGLANVATSVAGLRLSPDYRTGYFQGVGRTDAVGNGDLYTATRAGIPSPFENVALIPGSGINSPLEESDPTVSGNALFLVFARAQGIGDPVHLYGATRLDSSMPFSGVQPLANVNDSTAGLDVSPFLREDGRLLYFASSRVPQQSTDIYVATWMGQGFGAPQAVPELNTSFEELSPVVTPDDRVVYYASDRSDGSPLGDYDIWVATRASTLEAFSPPTNVAALNSPALDLPTFVTRDGCAIYLSSNRSGELLPYVATRPSR